MPNVSDILHPENLRRLWFTGSLIYRSISKRIEAISQGTTKLQDPNVSIVIRTRNDIEYFETLIKDIKAQVYDAEVEIIVVDTESTDGTLDVAEKYADKIIRIKQVEFNYPKSLNVGFSAASHSYVVTLVGHSTMVSKYFLKSLTYWSQQPDFAGLFGITLPNSNATFIERLSTILNFGLIMRKAKEVKRRETGLLQANCSIIKRSVWKQFGGYDEEFAGGGEDSDLALKIIASGQKIIKEPASSVYHSHGLGALNFFRQYRHWLSISKPNPFNQEKIFKRRPDLSKN